MSFKLSDFIVKPRSKEEMKILWDKLQNDEKLKKIPTRPIGPNVRLCIGDDDDDDDENNEIGGIARKLSFLSSTADSFLDDSGSAIDTEGEGAACGPSQREISSDESEESALFAESFCVKKQADKPPPHPEVKQQSFAAKKPVDINKFYSDILAEIRQLRRNPKIAVHRERPVYGSCARGNSQTALKEAETVKVKGVIDFPDSREKNTITNVEREERGDKENSFVVNGKVYDVISLLGSGSSCKVYSVVEKNQLDQKNILAIKCVNLDKADDAMKKMIIKEIEYLTLFKNSDYVIKMIDHQFCSKELFIVLEKGDTDLAHYLLDERKKENLTPIMIRFLWHEMLKAIEEIHSQGIIHSDLKPANFLLVSGHLKLIDFGIASSVPNDMTSILREDQIGTVNYMSPETVKCHSMVGSVVKYKISVKTDVWSLGCILYNMVYGTTPFSHIRSMYGKIQAITDPQVTIRFPHINDQQLMDVLQKCLVRNPRERASVAELLSHPYLTRDSVQPADNDLDEIISRLRVLTPTKLQIVSSVIDKLSRKNPY